MALSGGQVAEAVETVLSEMPMLRKIDGKMVHELRPEVDWNKGRAVEWLLENIKEEYGEEDVFPIYIGDDVTDEDAFRTLRNGGAIDTGLGIIVADSPVYEGATEATFQLRNPQEVLEFLHWFTLPEQAGISWQSIRSFRKNNTEATEEAVDASLAAVPEAEASDIGSLSGTDTPSRQSLAGTD